MVSTTILTNLLLATTAFAASSEAILNRRATAHQYNTTQNLEAPVNNVRATIPNNIWAGAMYNGASGTFIAVSGVFTIPTIPPALSGTIAIAVGLDAATCKGVVFQTGIEVLMKDAQAIYLAWYEWYPDPTRYFLDYFGLPLYLSVGHVVRLTVASSQSSPNKGTAYIENLTTGKFVYKDIESSNTLCQQDAVWIVEVMPGAEHDFTNFGTVVFTEAHATTTSNDKIGPGDANIVVMQRNNQIVTTTSVNSSAITIHYN